MLRSIRGFLVLAIATVLSSGSAVAGVLTTQLAGTAVRAPIGGVLTPTTCGAVTPVVYDLKVSVPPTGTGNACTNDLQCTGAGEACVYPSGNPNSGTCMASGLLTRDHISYVAGNLIDVEVTIPECTGISTVNGQTLLGGSCGFESTCASNWSFLPSGAATTVNGQPAIRQRVRIQQNNFGDGQTAQISIQVAARTGGATTTRTFLVSQVAAVNAAMRNTVAETAIRNAFVTRIYEKFGDYEQVLNSDGSRKAYGVDWRELEEVYTSNGRFFRHSDIRILDGEIAFSTEFKGDVPGCDPTVSIDGWFGLIPSGDGYDFDWIGGPRAGQWGGVCTMISLGVFELIIDGLSDEAALEQDFARSLSNAFHVDENGHFTVCSGCRVRDIVIGDGKIDIWTVPPVDRVRVNVRTDLRTDVTSDPNRGVLLPKGLYAPIVAGGTYESCQASNGQSPATCPVKFELDMDGLFNWWGSDVPVPSPIACNQYGTCAVLGGRANAWDRLLGVTRDVTKLPEKSFPVGSLLARRTPLSAYYPTTRARVTNGCVMPPNALANYKVALGVNDIATPVTGDPPTKGKLDVTLLLAADAGQSEVLFKDFTTCTAAPSTGGGIVAPIGTAGTLAR
jgi:hypothetical protein